MMIKNLARLASATTMCAVMASASFAQAYPERPIKMIVGFPPGGAVDIIARSVSNELGERLGQPVIVENRAGAGGNIAAEQVSRAAPDGYTVLVSAVSSLAISASLYRNIRYDLLKDLEPVAVIASVPNVLVVNPAVPAKTVGEFVALAKSQPGKLNFGSAGTGTTVHFSGELFKAMAGVDMVHVPYKGAAPAMTDLLGGQVQLMFDFLSAALPQIKAGKLRPLGVTSATRSPLLPDVPTIAEAGVPGYEVLGNFGIFAPAGVPKAVIERLNKELAAVVNLPQVRARLAEQAATPELQSVEAFQTALRAEVDKWAKIVKSAGGQLD